MRRKIIPYNPILKERARKMRNNPTKAEKLLWLYLKKKQALGYDFDRQRPIDNYIVDFYCKDLMLAIEVDGDSHIGNEEKDKKRTNKLNSHGVTVLRFDNDLVLYDTQKVLTEIKNWIRKKQQAQSKVPFGEGI